MLRVGIYGGAFAPIHKGHVEAARAFIDQMRLDVLFVVPTGVSPHKQIDLSATAEDRMEMCRIALRDVGGIIISDIEIRRKSVNYSIDTVRELSGDDRRLFLLCGTDMMLTIGEWDEADEIFRLSYPVYARRENDRELDSAIIQKNKEYFERFGRYVIKLDMPVTEISSSILREKLKRGEDVTEYMDSEVIKYIEKKELYR